MTEIKLRNIKDKVQLSLLPWLALSAVARVMEGGAGEYGENDWQNIPNAEKVYRDALLRHVRDFGAGVQFDKKSKLSVVAHIVANGLIVLWFDITRGRITEDGVAVTRYEPEPDFDEDGLPHDPNV